MSLCRDKQIKHYLIFLILFVLLLFGISVVSGINQTSNAKAMYLQHDEAMVSSLLEQGVSKDIIAAALSNTKISESGRTLLAAAGIGRQTDNRMLPFIHQFQQSTFYTAIMGSALLTLVFAIGTMAFFWKRRQLYEQAGKVLQNYINGEYSCHLPQNSEGTIYQIFAANAAI